MEIDFRKPRYDQKTFWGRFRHFVDVTDSRGIFVTDAQIEEAKNIIKQYKEKGTTDDPEKIWKAKKILDSAIHPDTGEKILLPFRMSSFLPINILICIGMLLPGGGVANQVFWQWFNQSYNICVNHSNRNASNPMSNKEIAMSYIGAVSTSCGIALGLGLGVDKLPFKPNVKHTLKMLVPFFSVSFAGIVNVFLMRRNEIINGINVKTKDGEDAGKSKKAGLSAVTMVAISRIVTGIPVLTVVPFILNSLSKTKLIQSKPKLILPINVALICLGLQIGLPAAIALFPQTVEVPANSLEPEFHNYINNKGEKEQHFYFNRGL